MCDRFFCCIALAVLGSLAGFRPAAAADALIAAPGVTRAGDGHQITFKVAKPVDVTVRIVSADSTIIRHLASGMVGLKNAAAPFAPATLEQTLTWDGKDDHGKPAPAGCKVWIAAGMSARFDKFIVWEKDACPRSRANDYYTAPTGETYVNQTAGTHIDTLRVFDKDGRYLRQAWPPSLNKPKAAVERLLASQWGASDWDNNAVPIKVCYNSWYLFGVRSKGMLRTSDGYLLGIFAGVGQGMFALDTDDFPAAIHWQAPWFSRNQMYKTTWRAAAGTDGDFYYSDSFHHVVGHFRAKGMTPIDSFTHSGKQKLDRPRYFVGEIGKAGEDDGHFTGPDDIAVDTDGNLCVLDGHKVKVYNKAGQFVREGNKADFPAAPAIPPAVKDREKNPRALCFPQFLKMLPGGRLLIMNQGVRTPVLQTDVDGKAVAPFPLKDATPYHGYSACDPAGNWYAVMAVPRQPQQIWKFSPDGKREYARARFGDKDAIVLQQENDPYVLSKGIAIAPSGDILVVVQTDKWKTKAPDQTGGVKFGDLTARGEAACQTRVDVYSPDGTLKTRGLVKSLGINDVAIDRDGGIYIIEGTMWHGAQMGLTAQGAPVYGRQAWPFPYLSPEQAALDPKTQSNKRYSLLSRLVKFSPNGGTLDDASGKSGKGQLWDRDGVSGVSPWNCDAECPAAQICLDSDERLWVPDSFMYCIKAVDKAGNEILRLGKYGNEDNHGGGGDKRHPDLPNVIIDPEIPLSYPKGIAVHRDSLFISDMFAHRIMRCKLQYAQVAEAAIP